MREREILIPCGIIRNVCKFHCVFVFFLLFLFLFSHSYKLVMSTHIHPTAAHSHTHIFRGVCTVIAKSFIAHCSLKSIWFVCFFIGQTATQPASGSRPSESFLWDKKEKGALKRKSRQNPRRKFQNKKGTYEPVSRYDTI